MASPGNLLDKHLVTKRWFRNNKASYPRLDLDSVDWPSASLPTDDYNCFGFAVGVPKWWQPPSFFDDGSRVNPDHYWPTDTEAQPTMQLYVQVAVGLGFVCVENGNWEQGFEKIVICGCEKGALYPRGQACQ